MPNNSIIGFIIIILVIGWNIFKFDRIRGHLTLLARCYVEVHVYLYNVYALISKSYFVLWTKINVHYLLSLTIQGTNFCFLGVLLSTDFSMVLSIIDPSLHENDQKLKCLLFHREKDKLPFLDVGKIVRLHRLKVKKWIYLFLLYAHQFSFLDTVNDLYRVWSDFLDSTLWVCDSVAQLSKTDDVHVYTLNNVCILACF